MFRIRSEPRMARVSPEFTLRFTIFFALVDAKTLKFHEGIVVELPSP